MMIKAFGKLPIAKSINLLKNRELTDYVFAMNHSFSTNKPTESAHSQSKNHHSKHFQDFQNLQNQANPNQTQENLRKFALGSSFEGIKHKFYEGLKFNKEHHKQAENLQHPHLEKRYQAFEQEFKANEAHEAEKVKQQEFSKVEKVETVSEKKDSKISSVLGLKSKAIIGSVSKFVTESLEETFPADNFQKKAEQIKRKAREMKQEQELTEEQLERLQGEIPEWKRTAIATIQGDVVNETSVRSKIMNAVKHRVNETDAAKEFYRSESYKDIQGFRQEMHQFKEDFKDHLAQSQNPAVMASMAVYSKVTTESNTARAIQEMRKFIPRFSVYELEKDAKGVFAQIFEAFLEGNLEFIQKTCGESALVYFRTLLKKREVDNVYPKYTYLWEVEPAELIGGKISAENNRACFTFTIRVQEIYCNVSKKNNKIVDGAEDLVNMNRYNFVLTLHENPDLEEAGHSWELIEVLPVEAIQMLA